MHGLPADIDLSPFAASELIQVAFGEHQVQLAFVGDDVARLVVAVESSYRVTAGEHSRRFGTATGGAVELLSLLGGSVASAAGEADGTLVLTFTDGRRIEIYEDPMPYESYQIHTGEELIVV